jgi:hypothetical protein
MAFCSWSSRGGRAACSSRMRCLSSKLVRERSETLNVEGAVVDGLPVILLF